MEKIPVFQRRIFWDVDFDKLDYENEAGPGFVWEDANARFGIFCLIDGVKLDIVRNLHQRIGDRQKEDGHEDSGHIGSGTEKGFLGHWRTSSALYCWRFHFGPPKEIPLKAIAHQYSAMNDLFP